MSSPAGPVLVEAFDAYLRRRDRSAVAFCPGEAVTAAVALLRGCRGATGRFTGTRWWLRADGCPVIEDEEGRPDAIAATADALERIATMTDVDTREMLTRARESVLTMPPRDWDAVERRLLQHAQPVPLILGPLTPAAEAPPPRPQDSSPSAPSRILALVDTDLADAVREIVDDVRGRWRRSPAVRLGAICAAVAVVVATGLLMWPTDDGSATPMTEPSISPVDGGSRTAGSSATWATATDAPTATVAPTSTPASPLPDEAVRQTDEQPQGRPSTADELVASARHLFAEIGRCAGDPSCAAVYEEDAGFPRERLLVGADDADIQLIDDFGGVFVVRVGIDSTSQYVTLVRQDDRWLVRAVKTVTDQPS